MAIAFAGRANAAPMNVESHAGESIAGAYPAGYRPFTLRRSKSDALALLNERGADLVSVEGVPESVADLSQHR
jgi:hypothetical protein